MTGKTLTEKQMFYFNGHRCPYCDKESDLVSSDVIHQEEHGMIYYCKDCDAAVGTLYGDQALGCLAKKHLRDQRRYCFKLLDQLIDKKISFGKIKRRTAKNRMNSWICKLLNITKVECHIGYWNEDQCRKVIEECKKHLQ